VSTLTLFHLSDQLRDFERLADSEDLPAEVIADTLEALTGSFEDKAVAVAKFVLSLEANAKAVAAVAKAQTERAARIEKRAASIKAYLLFHMQATQLRRIESPELTLRVHANPAAVVVTDEHAIPEQYWRQPDPPPKVIDKKAIKAAIDAGERVEGAYVNQREHLRISV